MNLTMEKFARLVGVSRATVSRVINDHPRVAPETRERILAAMAEYQYMPNGLARGLVTRRTGVIGMVATSTKSPYHADLIQAVGNELYEWNYSAIFAFSGGLLERERKFIKMLKERQVDGLLVSLLINEHGVRENTELVQQLRSQGLPVVLIDHHFRDSIADYITHDLYGASQNVVKYLIDLGHRRIGYLCNRLHRQPNGQLSGDDRMEGYRVGLANAGIPFDESLVAQTVHSVEGGYDGAMKLIRMDRKPTAIFCYTDLLAVGALKAVRDAGLKVPDDISIVGCDDSDLAARAEVPLTTIRLAKEEMGKQAARILVEKIKTKDLSHEGSRQVILSAELVIRESTARCHQS